MKNIFLYFNGAVLAGVVRGCLPKNVKAKGINPWFCFLLCAALLYSPLSFGKNHDSHRVQSQTTTQSAEESQDPIIEYVRVKMGKSIFLEPPEEDEPGIYLRIRDTSGNDFELQDIIAEKLKENGYKIVKNAKHASYVLRANILFAEEVSEAQLHNINESDYDQDIGSVLGAAVVGAAVGGVADANIGSSSSLGAGSVVGALVGLAVSASQAQKKEEELKKLKATKFFSAVVDIEVRQRTPDGGEVIRRGRTNTEQNIGSASVGSSLTGNDIYVESDTTESEEVDTYRSKSDWIRYKARVIATAKGKHITIRDIEPKLLDKLSKSLSGMF